MSEPVPLPRVLLGDGKAMWLQMNCSLTLCLSDARGPGLECRNAVRAEERPRACRGRASAADYVGWFRGGRFCWVSGRGRQAGRAPTTEAGLPPRDVHPFPGTGSGVVGQGAAQAVPAVRAGADVVVTVLQVGQRAHGVVAGLELGGRQERACRLRELGCGGGERGGEPGLARALPQPGCPGPQGVKWSPALQSSSQLLPPQHMPPKHPLAV